MGASDQMAQAITEAQPTDAALQEGAAYSTATPENPLQRNIVVSVRASLNELCLQKQKGTWAPSTEALRSMFQQKVRYTHTRTTRRPPPTAPDRPRPPPTASHALRPCSPCSQKYTGLDGSADAQGDLKVRAHPCERAELPALSGPLRLSPHRPRR